MLNHKQLKVLRTAEFAPYVVFIAAPDLSQIKGVNVRIRKKRRRFLFILKTMFLIG